MNILNNNGSRTDLCGIPEIISHQSLKLKPIFYSMFPITEEIYSEIQTSFVKTVFWF